MHYKKKWRENDMAQLLLFWYRVSLLKYCSKFNSTEDYSHICCADRSHIEVWGDVHGDSQRIFSYILLGNYFFLSILFHSFQHMLFPLPQSLLCIYGLFLNEKDLMFTFMKITTYILNHLCGILTMLNINFVIMILFPI